MHAHPQITPIITVGLLHLGLFATVAGGEARPASKVRACGPLALQTCMTLLGRSVEATLCADLSGTDERGNTTMAGLLAASRQLGEQALSLNLTSQELALLNRPAILHVSYPSAPEHFSVFACYRDGRFELINPTLGIGRELLSERQLGLIWDGRCLVFGENPSFGKMKLLSIRLAGYVAVLCGLGAAFALMAVIPRKRPLVRTRNARRRPTVIVGGSLLLVICGATIQAASRALLSAKTKQSLVLGMDILDLGDCSVGVPVVRDTWCANMGQDSLQIDKKRTKASCSCLRVRVAADTLAPGDKSLLSIRLAPKRVRGRFEHKVYVTGDREEKGQTLIVRGNVIGPGVPFPPRLYFGRVRPGEHPARTFVCVAKYPDCKVLRLESSSSAVKCTTLQTRPGLANIGVSLAELPADGPFRGCVRLIAEDRETTTIEVPFEGTVTHAP